ncbi:hypothetical protein GZ78_08090 [Endozoicomonas numazuensis]|uniref:Uncharacterized protein n=1 Tax=Endozoicomonas numazuensis TaxID=1137799 RepID=A0A081NMY3_9GAMM|nr:hypothetical protein GZ78_08090 [Endozoicomonas numazuensis]
MVADIAKSVAMESKPQRPYLKSPRKLLSASLTKTLQSSLKSNSFIRRKPSYFVHRSTQKEEPNGFNKVTVDSNFDQIIPIAFSNYRTEHGKLT